MDLRYDKKTKNLQVIKIFKEDGVLFDKKIDTSIKTAIKSFESFLDKTKSNINLFTIKTL